MQRSEVLFWEIRPALQRLVELIYPFYLQAWVRFPGRALRELDWRQLREQLPQARLRQPPVLLQA